MDCNVTTGPPPTRCNLIFFGSTPNFSRIIHLMFRVTLFPLPATLSPRTTIFRFRLILSLHSHCHSFSDKAPVTLACRCFVSLFLLPRASLTASDIPRQQHLLAHRRFRHVVARCDRCPASGAQPRCLACLPSLL